MSAKSRKTTAVSIYSEMPRADLDYLVGLLHSVCSLVPEGTSRENIESSAANAFKDFEFMLSDVFEIPITAATLRDIFLIPFGIPEQTALDIIVSNLRLYRTGILKAN